MPLKQPVDLDGLAERIHGGELSGTRRNESSCDAEIIPVAGPWITEKEIRYVMDAASSGWYGRHDHHVRRFEDAFAKYLGVKHALAVPHCTSAIHLALAGFGIGPGDEVIVPEITWIASAAPIHYVGANPVFADIDETTWCISVDSVKQCISPRTKAIIPVGLYGLIPNMAALRRLADDHGLLIIEDAAQSLGSKFKGKLAGTFGDAGAFSFHGTKTLTTGEGGMLVTDNSELFERVNVLRDHGRSKRNHKTFLSEEVAYKYRMSCLQAAFGLAQIERVHDLVARKRRIFEWYAQRLSGLPGLQLNAEPEGYFNSYWMVTILLSPSYNLDKQSLMNAMAERNIDTRPIFYPMSSLPAFKDTPDASRAKKHNNVSYEISPFGLNLPSAMCLTEHQVDHVCSALRNILAQK